MWDVELSRRATKAYLELSPDLQNRIGAKIDQLIATPRPPSSKKLQGSRNEYRMRVGEYRILYEVFPQEKVIVVAVIEKRGQAGLYR